MNFELAFGHCQSGLDTATISCQKPIEAPAHATTDLVPAPMSNVLFPVLDARLSERELVVQGISSHDQSDLAGGLYLTWTFAKALASPFVLPGS